MPNTYRITADNALRERRELFIAGLEVLQLVLAKMNPDEPNWGHVGSASYAVDHINEILSHYGIKQV